MRPFYKHTKKLQTWLLPAPISSVTPSRHGSVQVGNKHYGWGCPCRVWVKFTWMITLSGLQGRKRRGSRIFTQTLAKRLIFSTCLLVKHGLAWGISAVRQSVFGELCGLFFSALCILFLLFSSLHRSSLRILEFLREVWSWFWIVFHSLLIWGHGVRIISPKQ